MNANPPRTSRWPIRAALAAALITALPATAASFDVVGRDIGSLRVALERHEVTAESLVKAYLHRIATLDRAGPSLHAVLSLNPDALAQARALDRERAAGQVRGPLHGIPILVKDNIETADRLPTTAGSLALAQNLSTADAPVIAKLRAAGAIILGKTNLSEWANIRSSVAVSGWSALGGQTRNPYALDRNPCGSSAGSGAAVAASLAAAAIGSETDGSITCPASMNGVVGIKPTVGLLSRQRIVPISSSQDTAGPLTHTVADAALLLGVMAGSDPEDPATAGADGHRAALGAGLHATDLHGVRIGLVSVPGVLPAVTQMMQALSARLTTAGATIVPLELPDAPRLGDFENTVMLTELKVGLASYLAHAPASVKVRSLMDVIEFDRAHAHEEMPLFGQDLFEKAEQTGGLDDPAYRQAREQSRRMAADWLTDAFDAHHVRAIIAPTMPPAMLTDPVNGDAMNGAGPGNLPAIAGYPHLSMPLGMVKGLPVGVSVIGPAWADDQMLALAAAFDPLIEHIAAPQYLSTVRTN